MTELKVDNVKESIEEKDNIERGKQLEDNCVIEGNFDLVIKSFEDFGLKNDLLKGIFAYGFVRPSPIQARAIAPCIQGKDIIAQAQSGTGKTATFVISSLQKIDTTAKDVQCLVIVPTRELAVQIRQVYSDIGQYMNIKCLDLIGGVSVHGHREALRNEHWHVVIGTPGRIIHLSNENYLDLSKVKLLILDEADVMLDRGFVFDCYEIFKLIPPETQVILLSATFPERIEDLTKKFMRDPVKLVVKKEQLTLHVIKQFYVLTRDKNDKVDAVIGILMAISIPQMVIFVKSQQEATLLCDVLKKEKFEVEFLHGGLTQAERSEIMNKFRKCESKLLISTNLVSRGIDVQGVSLVINFDLPKDKESYLHRIGRSGRYGRRGMAINLISEEELTQIKELEQFYNTTISELPENFGQHL